MSPRILALAVLIADVEEIAEVLVTRPSATGSPEKSGVLNAWTRIGLPEEIAQAVVYFASDESAYTTGQILSVSGGFGLGTPLYGELSGKDMRR